MLLLVCWCGRQVTIEDWKVETNDVKMSYRCRCRWCWCRWWWSVVTVDQVDVDVQVTVGETKSRNKRWEISCWCRMLILLFKLPSKTESGNERCGTELSMWVLGLSLMVMLMWMFQSLSEKLKVETNNERLAVDVEVCSRCCSIHRQWNFSGNERCRNDYWFRCWWCDVDAAVQVPS